MDPQRKTDLLEFTVLAKAVIYNKDRMAQLIEMMETPEGAVQAVHAVVAAIEQRKRVPANVAPLLGMNVYLLMVDSAAQITGEQPDPEIVQSVVMTLLQEFAGTHAERPAGPAEEASAPPAGPAGGLIGAAMGG